jgi:hypothetical protein
MPSNLAVDTDTLRQGAARRRGQFCTARRLAAACRSLLRYVAADQRHVLLLPLGHALGFDHRFMPRQNRRREVNQAVSRGCPNLRFALPAAAGAVDIASRAAVGSTSLGLAPRALDRRRQAQPVNAAPRSVAGGAHNMAVDTDALAARWCVPMVRRSPLR